MLTLFCLRGRGSGIPQSEHLVKVRKTPDPGSVPYPKPSPQDPLQQQYG